MFEVLNAERIKLARHRVTWFTVWIFPIGIALVLAAVTVWIKVRGGPPEVGPPDTAATWIKDTATFWAAPGSTLGRYLLAAFTAVAFGGEYGWNTWKLIAPHRPRAALLGAKYAVVLALIATAIVLMTVIAVLMSLLYSLVLDDPIPTGVAFGDLLAFHGRAGAKVLLAVLLTVAYASAGAVLTRSTLAGAIIGVVAVTAEALVGQWGQLLNPTLFQALPSYHLDNLGRWIDAGEPLRKPFPKTVVEHGWAVSLASLTAWIGGLTLLTIAAFRRQDLN